MGGDASHLPVVLQTEREYTLYTGEEWYMVSCLDDLEAMKTMLRLHLLKYRMAVFLDKPSNRLQDYLIFKPVRLI